MNRDINQDNLETEFKQDYINIDNTTAISAEGVIFKVGDSVGHEGTKDKTDRAIITHFSIDFESFDVIAHTEKGFGRISFMYH